MAIELLHNLPLLLTAFFLAGALNAAAGGGTFLTLPALIVAGLPAVAANATGTVALLPGYVTSTYAFRKDLGTPNGVPMWAAVAVSLLGGAAGAVLLVTTPGSTFRVMIPWLMLLGTAAFAAGPHLVTATGRARTARPLMSLLWIFLVCVYGGYFNGGLGIILLALLGLLGMSNLNSANGLKNLISAVLTAIAVVVYALGGKVSWPAAIVMMIASAIGGYVGGIAIRHVKEKYFRYGVIAVGLIMTVLFFIK